MSYTTVKALWPGEKIEDVEELRNSHGSAPLVWNEIAKKYLGCRDFAYMHEGTTKRLWPLWKHLGIPKAHRAVLMMTYDHAYVKREDYQRAAEDIRTFLADFPMPAERANHWPRIAEIFAGKPDVPAIGFNMTSVTCDLWVGEWDEGKEEYGPFDWAEAFDVYAEIDGLKG